MSTEADAGARADRPEDTDHCRRCGDLLGEDYVRWNDRLACIDCIERVGGSAALRDTLRAGEPFTLGGRFRPPRLFFVLALVLVVGAVAIAPLPAAWPLYALVVLVVAVYLFFLAGMLRVTLTPTTLRTKLPLLPERVLEPITIDGWYVFDPRARRGKAASDSFLHVRRDDRARPTTVRIWGTPLERTDLRALLLLFEPEHEITDILHQLLPDLD